MRPITRDEFTRDYSAVQAAVRSGVVLGRTAKATHTWELWLAFCTKHAIDPWFTDQDDPIPYLQVFGQRYRDGRLAPGQKPVRSRTVADALCLVGQTYKLLGARDHRLDHYTGQIDFRLQRQFRAYEKSDAPPQRVKPIPIRLVSTVLTNAHNNSNPSSAAQAIADMICIAFFFLLRPGEYTFTNANTPFRIQDVKLYIDTKELQIYQASPLEFSNVTSVSLTFTTQKNGVKGEVISHGLSGDLLVCPCRATVRRIQHLLQHQQPPSTPLCKFFQDHTHGMVTPTLIRDTLRRGLNTVGHTTLGIHPNQIDARSLRAGGATALLCANVDHNTIQLLGRWKSDAMMRYLHISANPQVHQHAHQMFTHGQASFSPPSSQQPDW
jgi:hypothetical protein